MVTDIFLSGKKYSKTFGTTVLHYVAAKALAYSVFDFDFQGLSNGIRLALRKNRIMALLEKLKNQ